MGNQPLNVAKLRRPESFIMSAVTFVIFSLLVSYASANPSNREDCTSCEDNLGGMSIKVLNLMKTTYCGMEDYGAPEYCALDGILDNLINLITVALSTDGALGGAKTMIVDDCEIDMNTVLFDADNQEVFTAKLQSAVELAESTAGLDDDVKTAINGVVDQFIQLLATGNVSA